MVTVTDGILVGFAASGPSKFLFFAPLAFIAVGTLIPLAWFIYLGIRLLRRRRASAETPPQTTTQRVLVVALSLALAIVGALCGLLLQLSYVGLTQRAECVRLVKTCHEIRRIESACALLLSDSGKRDFRDLIASPDTAPLEDVTAEIAWDTVVPELLGNGAGAEAPLDPEARKKLAASYFDVGTDAWGFPYQFTISEFSTSFPAEYLVAVRSLGHDGIPSRDDVVRDSYPVMDQDKFEFYDAGVMNRTPFARIYTLLTGRKWLQPNEAFLSD